MKNSNDTSWDRTSDLPICQCRFWVWNQTRLFLAVRFKLAFFFDIHAVTVISVNYVRRVCLCRGSAKDPFEPASKVVPDRQITCATNKCYKSTWRQHHQKAAHFLPTEKSQTFSCRQTAFSSVGQSQGICATRGVFLVLRCAIPIVCLNHKVR